MTAKLPLSRRLSRVVTAIAVGALVAGLASCDFLDPTRVENPQTTDDDLAGAAEPTTALMPGLRAEFADAIRAVVTISENVSDNYSIHGTALNVVLDEPHEVSPDIINATGSTGIYFNLQELRALADFVLDEVAPGDETASDADIAEAHYYRGMAHLMMAENFVAAPLEIDGAPVGGDALVATAITELEASLQASPDGDFALPAQAALARAYRLQGNDISAVTFASSVLAADPEFLFAQGFDESSLTNTPFTFLVLRDLQEMQPLPRLDFLDPKYITRDAAIPVAKAEEMHLILAEAALGDGQLAQGADHIADAIELALARPTVTFEDGDLRKNRDLTIRPRHASLLVRADENSPYRAGLILDRPGGITVHPISGTSLDPDSIRGLADEASILHAYFLARQEILFLEGRRMSDLGIRLPVMLREIETNASIQPGDPATEPLVPSYIPTLGGMDLFTPSTPYTADSDELDPVLIADPDITILVDMNRILAENRAAPLLN